MPEISKFYEIKITMYYEDHNPPHFHAKYGNNTALIDINNCCIIKGYLPSPQTKLVLAWCIIHQQELLENWKLSKNGEPLIKIAPLI